MSQKKMRLIRQELRKELSSMSLDEQGKAYRAMYKEKKRAYRRRNGQDT